MPFQNLRMRMNANSRVMLILASAKPLTHSKNNSQPQAKPKFNLSIVTVGIRSKPIRSYGRLPHQHHSNTPEMIDGTIFSHIFSFQYKRKTKLIIKFNTSKKKIIINYCKKNEKKTRCLEEFKQFFPTRKTER